MHAIFQMDCSCIALFPPPAFSSLEIMKEDTRRMRGERPYVMCDMKSGTGLGRVVSFIRSRGLLDA